MINLPQVTLVAVSSVRIDQTIKALEYSSKDIKFGSVKLISDIEPLNLSNKISFNKIEKINNIDEWNYSIIYKLPTYIRTDFCILIHDNGFIVNSNSWKDEFLKYDYIGAPWPLPVDDYSYRDINNNLIRVGNSVSLRSKKLLNIPLKHNLEWKAFHGYTNEDGFICCNYRHKYLEEGCKFADIDVAKYFSHENSMPETKGIKPFAFHNYLGENSQYPKF
jgi:hypothetical protein